MKMKILFSFILLFIWATVSSSKGVKRDKGVIILNAENFGTTLTNEKYALVLFYPTQKLKSSPWNDKYTLVAKRINKFYPGIKLCKMDSTENQALAKTYAGGSDEIVIKLFRKNGDPLIYDQKINANNLVDWIVKEVDNSITEVSTVDEVENLIAKHQHVGIYLGTFTSANYKPFLSYTTTVLDVTFLKSEQEELLERFDIDDEGFIMVRERGLEINTLKENFTFPNIQKFGTVYKDPVVLPLNAAVAKRINTGNMDVVFFIKKDDTSLSQQEAFKAIALQQRGNIFFVEGLASGEYGQKVSSLFNMTGKSLPYVAIYHATDNQRKYILDRDITERNLQVFLANFYQRNLIAFIKSASVGEIEYDGDVMIVVGANYYDIVRDENKDVLIEWYSPKCKHCKKFNPKYKIMAEQLKDVKDLVIAKIDALQNEVDGMELLGYPDIRFYPRGQKHPPISYTGDREIEPLLDFLKTHATVDINV